MKIIKKEALRSIGYQRVSFANLNAINCSSSQTANGLKSKSHAMEDSCPAIERFMTARVGRL